MTAPPLFAGLEAGGTKFRCVVGRAPDKILEETVVPTQGPEPTFARCRAFFAEAAERFGAPAALGIAAFGPIGVDPEADGYGVVGRTPKSGWAGAAYVAAFRGQFDRIAVATDVDGAGLGEQLYGAGRGARTIAYVTIGTGVGAGVLKDGAPLSGRTHYELGHIRPPRDGARDAFPGVCPSHGDCLEGLASGPAILARWGHDLSALPAEHPAHDLEADYLAQLMLTLSLAHAPEIIVVGGGVAKTEGLLHKVRTRTDALLAGYVETPAIVAPALGERSGVVGALALAARAAAR